MDQYFSKNGAIMLKKQASTRFASAEGVLEPYLREAFVLENCVQHDVFITSILQKLKKNMKGKQDSSIQSWTISSMKTFVRYTVSLSS